jgi:hypothetical protein
MNVGLQELILSGIDIGDSGAQAIAKSMKASFDCFL